MPIPSGIFAPIEASGVAFPDATNPRSDAAYFKGGWFVVDTANGLMLPQGSVSGLVLAPGSVPSSALANGAATGAALGADVLVTGSGSQSKTGILTAPIRDNGGQVVNALAYGAIGDITGASHPISAGDVAANPQWIGTYVAGDEWDYVGIQEAIYAAFAGASTPGNIVWNGNSGQHKNKTLHIPKGYFRINKTLQIVHMVGGLIEGEGRLATVLIKVAPFLTGDHVLSTNGISHAAIRDIGFGSTGNHGTAGSLLNLDWDNSSGGGGLHGLLIENVHFDGTSGGASVEYGCRVAYGAHQGDTFNFVSCLFQGGTVACVACFAFNALSEHFENCDFINTLADGIYIEAGSATVLNCQFEGVAWGVGGQTGYCLRLSTGAANHTSTMIGCRLEVPRLASTGGAGPGLLTLIGNCVAVGALRAYTPNTAYTLNQTVRGNSGVGVGSIYVCTTAGTTGSGEPTWVIGGGTVTDGTVVWTHQDYDVVSAVGAIYAANNILPYGTVTVSPSNSPQIFMHNAFSRSDWMRTANQPYDDTAIGSTRWGPICIANWVVSNGGISSTNPVAHVAPGHGANVDTISDIGPIWLGGAPIIWPLGSAGSMYGDVGLGRNDGTTAANNVGANDQTRYSRNVLALLGDGSLGRPVQVGSNLAGTALRLQGGLGTGTGVGGPVILRAAPAGSTGSTPNNAQDVLYAEPSGVRFQMYTKNGAPTISDVPAGFAAVYKDSGGGTVKLWVNDGGVMKSAALA